MSDKITTEEVAEMFGPYMSVEVANLLLNPPLEWSADDLRNELLRIAKRRGPYYAARVGDVFGLKSTKAGASGLVEAIDLAREELRLLLIRQPITFERHTYSDGFAAGLAHAIGTYDRALEKAATP